MKISWLKNRSLLFFQKKYILALFLYYKIENCVNITTLIMQKVKFSKNLDENRYNAKMQTNYRILLKKLIYQIIQTWPDLAYLVSKFIQFMNNSYKKY